MSEKREQRPHSIERVFPFPLFRFLPNGPKPNELEAERRPRGAAKRGMRDMGQAGGNDKITIFSEFFYVVIKSDRHCCSTFHIH